MCFWNLWRSQQKWPRLFPIRVKGADLYIKIPSEASALNFNLIESYLLPRLPFLIMVRKVQEFTIRMSPPWSNYWRRHFLFFPLQSSLAQVAWSLLPFSVLCLNHLSNMDCCSALQKSSLGAWHLKSLSQWLDLVGYGESSHYGFCWANSLCIISILRPDVIPAEIFWCTIMTFWSNIHCSHLLKEAHCANKYIL